MSVTKSLRISEEDDEFVKKLKRYLNEPTESAVLGRIFESGLQEELVNLALKIYQQSEHRVSLRTIAEDFDIAPTYLYTLCLNRGINLLETEKEDFKEDVDKASEFFEDPKLKKILDKLEE